VANLGTLPVTLSPCSRRRFFDRLLARHPQGGWRGARTSPALSSAPAPPPAAAPASTSKAQRYHQWQRQRRGKTGGTPTSDSSRSAEGCGIGRPLHSDREYECSTRGGSKSPPPPPPPLPSNANAHAQGRHPAHFSQRAAAICSTLCGSSAQVSNPWPMGLPCTRIPGFFSPSPSPSLAEIANNL
jgi:hypothetical protein